MACGTPTILANATSLPEVGGTAAVYFTPGDHEELAQVMRELARDPQQRAQMSQRGIEHAATFSWERCASETAEVYRQTLK